MPAALPTSAEPAGVSAWRVVARGQLSAGRGCCLAAVGDMVSVALARTAARPPYLPVQVCSLAWCSRCAWCVCTEHHRLPRGPRGRAVRGGGRQRVRPSFRGGKVRGARQWGLLACLPMGSAMRRGPGTYPVASTGRTYPVVSTGRGSAPASAPACLSRFSCARCSLLVVPSSPVQPAAPF